MKIAVLGNGVTANAVKNTIDRISELTLASVENADIIVASPGIPPSQYPSTQTPIISEIELAYRLFHRPTSTYCPRLIGITGTNGKTTITAMIAHVLECPAAGNIGIPLIEFVDNGSAEWIAVELSSYQLEQCVSFRPEIAIITNITPDHMERHGTMVAYAQAKVAIFRTQRMTDALIYWAEDPIVSKLVINAPSRCIPFGLSDADLLSISNPKLPGSHNRLNSLAAYKACQLTGISEPLIRQRIATFLPVEHRIEWVGQWEDRQFYNDSKATNPDSTKVAVVAFDAPIRLIICGQDKGLDLADFAVFLTQRVASIVAYGNVAARFIDAIKTVSPDFPIVEVEDTQQAIAVAWKMSHPGDIILFSPSQSSFDQFTNFEHRGKVFKQAVVSYFS